MKTYHSFNDQRFKIRMSVLVWEARMSVLVWETRMSVLVGEATKY